MTFMTGLFLIILPAVLLSYSLFKKDRLLNSLIICTTFLPVLVFFSHLSGIPITQESVVIISIILNILSIIIFTKSKSKIYFDLLKDKYFSFLIFLSTIIYGYLFFYLHPISLGGDTPHFLYNSGLIVSSAKMSLIFDRSIVYLFPSITHLLTGMSIEISLKIFIGIYFIIGSIVSYKISNRVGNKRLVSLIASLVVILSSSFLKSLLFTIPFSVGIILLYIILYKISEEKKDTLSILSIYFIWAFLFNIHGVIAFGSIPVVLSLLAVNQRKKIIKKWKIHSLGLVLFTILSQPLLFSHANKLVSGVIKPLAKKNTSSQTQIVEKKQNISTWDSEWTSSPKVSIKQFPLKRELFILKYSSLILLLSAYGLFIFSQEKKKNKGEVWILITFLFLYTQQQLFGVDWFTGRFVSSMSPIMYILFAYGVSTLINKLRQAILPIPKIVTPLLILGIGVFHIYPSISWFHRVVPVISEKEYNVYKDIDQYVKNKETIYLASSHNQWATGLSPKENFYRTKYKTMCNFYIKKSKDNYQDWEINRAFSEEYSPEQSMRILEENSIDSNFYVYINTNPTNCVNMTNFPLNDYEYIVNDGDGHHLLRKI